MAVYFFDSSGIIKRYVRETGTAWVASLTDPSAGNRLHLARITGVEVVAGVTRRQRGGSISAADAASMLAQFDRHLAGEYRVLEISPPLIRRAMELARLHGLRAYDAVQLAAVLRVNRERLVLGMPALTLVSADLALNAAAAAEGLSVEDPNTHP